MDFIIKQNATIPVLTMKLLEDYDTNIELFNSMIQNAVVTFSMIDVETGRYVIANKSGNIINLGDNTNVACGQDSSTYLITYEFTERDTRNHGQYKGEFTINFFDEDNNSKGKLITPMKEDLNIFIQETYGKTSINGF